MEEPGRVTLILPLKVESESNFSGSFHKDKRKHFAIQNRRHQEQKAKIKYYMNMIEIIPKPPCRVTLTRIAPRELDFDNLVYGFKWIRDAVADFIVPGLRPGRADSAVNFLFEYQQTKGKPKEYAMKIEIIERVAP